jgi:hypothetical protein
MKTMLKAREREGANPQPAPTDLQQLPAELRRNSKGAVHLSIRRDAEQLPTKEPATGAPGLWFLILIFLVSAIYVGLGGSFETSPIEMGPETAAVLVHRANTDRANADRADTPAAPREEDGSGPYP